MRAFLATSLATATAAVSINPTQVSNLLAQTEGEWVESAVVGLVNGAPGEKAAEKEMVASCSELVGSILKASDGEKDRVEEYFGDVCSASKKPGQCKQFQEALLGFMTDDSERNRNELNEGLFCSEFFAKVKDYAYAEASRRTEEKKVNAIAQKKRAAAQKLLAEKRRAEEHATVTKMKQQWYAKQEAEAKAKAALAKKQAAEAKAKKATMLKKRLEELKKQKDMAAKKAVLKKLALEKEAKAKVMKAEKEAKAKKVAAEKEAILKKLEVEHELAAKKEEAEKELKATKAKHEKELKKVTKLVLKPKKEKSALEKAKDMFFAAEARIEEQKAKFGDMIHEMEDKPKGRGKPKADKKPKAGKKKADKKKGDKKKL